MFQTRSEPSSLAFQASVLTTTPPRLPDVTMPPPMPVCQCGSLLERSVQITTVYLSSVLVPLELLVFNAYNYIHTGQVTLHIHTQGRLNKITERRVYRIMVTTTSVVDVMKMGNIAPRAEIKLSSLLFWVNVLTIMPPRFPDVTILPTPTCLCT